MSNVRRWCIGGGVTSFNKVFIYAGRLEPSKGIISLLTMWANFPLNYELHIYGDGSFKDNIIYYAEHCINIKFFGFQTQEIVFNDMKNSTAVIIASELYETFGMSIPESFSMAIPVIATNLGNPGAMIQESHGGCTYEINDFESLEMAMEDVIHNNLNYSLNAYAYYVKNLNGSQNYRKISEIYDKARFIK